MKKYDVVIVGAGPGGLRCAEILGQSKKKVLLVDRKKVIGPKVCAGGITNSNIQHFVLPPSILDHSYNKIKVYVGSKFKYLEQKEPFVHTVDRKNLGQYQLSRLDKKYVTVMKNTIISGIFENYVQSSSGEKYYFDYLVGADGSNSIVRKHLGLNTEKFALAIQYIIKTSKFKEFEMFADAKRFSSGYAWIFPHTDYVSIGTGCDPKTFSIKKLKNNFHEWLDMKKIDYSKGEYQAHTINYDYKGTDFGNKFLIGDAAGLASGLTGEGIQQAIISAEEIANKIINPKHKYSLIEKLLKQKKSHNLTLKILQSNYLARWFWLKVFILFLGNRKFNKKVIKMFV